MTATLFLFAIFIALSATDWLLTRTILGCGGVEVNPIMHLAYKYTGMTGIGAIKIAIAFCALRWQLDGTLPNWAMMICIAAYLATALHLRREVAKIDPEARAQCMARLIDPFKFGVVHWIGVCSIILGPLVTLVIWEVETSRVVQLSSFLFMMLSATAFATMVYYPKIGDPIDPNHWPKE